MTGPAEFWSARRLHVTVEGPQGRSVIPLPHPFARIGRDSGSDIVLANPWVARRSLYLHATDEGVFCFYLQPEETHEQRLGFWLAPGEPLMVGPYRISAALEGDVPGPAPALVPLDDWGGASPPYPLFQVYSAGVMRDKRRFRARLNLIGRRHECALQIKGQQVSAFHGCLFWQYPRLWYIDLVSSNGTALNGRSIECSEVRIGDQLEIGEFTLLYQRLSKGGTPRGKGAAAARPAAVSAADLLPADFEEDMPLDLDGQMPLQLEDHLADEEPGGSSPVIPLEGELSPADSAAAVHLNALAPVQQTRQELAVLERRVQALTQLTAQVGRSAAQQLAKTTHEAFEQERQRIAQELERRGGELALEKAALESQWHAASRDLATQVSHLRDEASLLARQRQAMEQSRLLWDAQRAELERQLLNYAQQLQRLQQASQPGLPAPQIALPSAPGVAAPLEADLPAAADSPVPRGLPLRRMSAAAASREDHALVLSAAKRGGAMTPRSHVVDVQVDPAVSPDAAMSGLPDFAARAALAAPWNDSGSEAAGGVLEGSLAASAAESDSPTVEKPSVNGAERPAIKGRKHSPKVNEAFDQLTDRMVEMELDRRKTMILVGIAAGAVVATLAAAMVLMAVLLR